MSESINHVYGEYLEHSLRYYWFDAPVISDEEFDTICKVLLKDWDKVTHKLKYLTDTSALEAGSGYQITATNLPSKFVQLVISHPDTRLKDVFAQEDSN